MQLNKLPRLSWGPSMDLQTEETDPWRLFLFSFWDNQKDLSTLDNQVKKRLTEVQNEISKFAGNNSMTIIRFLDGSGLKNGLSKIESEHRLIIKYHLSSPSDADQKKYNTSSGEIVLPKGKKSSKSLRVWVAFRQVTSVSDDRARDGSSSSTRDGTTEQETVDEEKSTVVQRYLHGRLGLTIINCNSNEDKEQIVQAFRGIIETWIQNGVSDAWKFRVFYDTRLTDLSTEEATLTRSKSKPSTSTSGRTEPSGSGPSKSEPSKPARSSTFPQNILSKLYVQPKPAPPSVSKAPKPQRPIRFYVIGPRTLRPTRNDIGLATEPYQAATAKMDELKKTLLFDATTMEEFVIHPLQVSPNPLPDLGNDASAILSFEENPPRFTLTTPGSWVEGDVSKAAKEAPVQLNDADSNNNNAHKSVPVRELELGEFAVNVKG